MSAMEKSDLPEVARKRANKAASAAAEPVERRGGAKENADLQSTVRTQSREAVSQAQARIREAVTRNTQHELTALLPHINIDCQRDDRGSPFSSLLSKMCLFAEQFATYKGRRLLSAPRTDPGGRC